MVTIPHRLLDPHQLLRPDQTSPISSNAINFAINNLSLVAITLTIDGKGMRVVLDVGDAA